MARDCAAPRARGGFALARVATILTMAAASAPSLFYPQIATRLHLLPIASTFIFAVYAFALLATLLYFGPLSDQVGRRPMVTLGSMLLALSLVLFWTGSSLPMLVSARALQGASAGLLIPALSAMMIDFEPHTRPGSAALWNTIGPMLGLGGGALGAALLLDLVSNPTGVVFGLLTLSFIAVSALVWATPEPITQRRIRRSGLRPQFAIPAPVRQAFIASVPAVIAGWATNGLFLALGAGLVADELAGSTHAHAGIMIFTLAISGVLASALLRRRPARTISLYATIALALGTTASLGALALHSYPAYLISVAVVGSGFGTSFLGVLSTLMPRTDPAERAGMLAVIYVVAYLAFGLPTIVAGLLVPTLTIAGAMTALGAVITALSTVAAVLRARVPEPASIKH